jgi:hypothetical protein
MAYTVDIDSTSASPQFVPVYIYPGGAGTNIAVVGGDTVNYWTAIDDNPTAAGTIVNGGNQTFTTEPLWITSNTVSQVTFTGPGY